MPIRLAVLSLLLSFVVRAQTPDQVLLLVNTASPQSLEIGAYYAQRRSIPASNVCRLALPTTETISRDVFNTRLLQPLQRFLAGRRLTERVLYIVTTSGVPLRVAGSGGISGENASVDSELTLLYSILHGGKPTLAGAVPNPYFARRQPFTHPEFGIYLVTRLAAYDVATVKSLIDRSLAARNRGKVVLDLKSDDEADGNNWLRQAAASLPPDRVILDTSPAVLSDRRNVIAYASWGSNDPHRTSRLPGFHWLPGAVATEYVSTNGRTFTRPPASWAFSSWRDTDRPKWFANSPQSLTADLLADGATAATGHVDEPYLGYTPRPNILIGAYLAGFNLAESYYASIPGLSWRNIVIGDPLCRLR